MALLAFAAEHRAAAPLLLAARRRRCRSMSLLSSKPAARRGCGRKMGQTDIRRDARPFHRSCCERRQQTVGQRKRSSICCRRVSVCPSVCHKPVLYRKDRTNRAGFFAWRLLSTYPTLCCKEISKKIRYLQKLRYFPLALCPKLRTLNISQSFYKNSWRHVYQ